MWADRSTVLASLELRGEELTVKNLTESLVTVSGFAHRTSDGRHRYFEAELRTRETIRLLTCSRREGVRLVLQGTTFGDLRITNTTEETVAVAGTLFNSATSVAEVFEFEIGPGTTVPLMHGVGAVQSGPEVSARPFLD